MGAGPLQKLSHGSSMKKKKKKLMPGEEGDGEEEGDDHNDDNDDDDDDDDDDIGSLDRVDEEELAWVTDDAWRRTTVTRPKKNDSAEPPRLEGGSDSEESFFEDEFNEEGFRVTDPADRPHLMSLPEIEREQILFDRHEARRARLDRWEALHREKMAGRTRRERLLGRDSKALSSKERKASALSDIRAARHDRLERDRDGRQWEKDRDKIRGYEQKREKDRDRELERAREREERARQEATRRKEEEDFFSKELNSVLVGRDQMAKWVDEPFFDEVVGLFVRVSVGTTSPLYKVAEIVGHKQGSKTYKVIDRELKTVLNLKHGRTIKAFRIEYLSNQPADQEEIIEWLDTLRKNKERPPSQASVKNLQEIMDKLKNHVYTPEEINRLVEEKKKKKGIFNLAMEKTNLLRAREAALEHEDTEAVERISQELQELEKKATERYRELQKKTCTIVEINRKNQSLNFMADLGQRYTVMAQAAAENDPFSRRPTRSSLEFLASKEIARSQDEDRAEAEAEAEAEAGSGTDHAMAQSLDSPARRESTHSLSHDSPSSNPLAAAHAMVDIDIDIPDSVSHSAPMGGLGIPDPGGSKDAFPFPLVKPHTNVSDSTTHSRLSVGDYYKRRKGL